VEQRQFAPKSDGVKRTIHEVIVRHCHLIAQPRSAGARALASPASEREDPQETDATSLESEHDPWPVR
jgi:hypothetical protein